MIVWLNGTFGSGKTTTSASLTKLEPTWRPFDPEAVGYMLADNLKDHEVSDFQQYPPWRRLVPIVADEIVRFTGQQELVAAQTVLVESYWEEIRSGLASRGHESFHVILDADAETLHARIDTDKALPKGVRPWRHQHVDTYLAALPWLATCADLIIDTVTSDATGVATVVRDAVRARLNGG